MSVLESALRVGVTSATVVSAAALGLPAAQAATSFDVTATVETAPVGHSGDAADDPAIWIHPSDPSKSVVVGTDKKGALEVYDLSGSRIQRIDGDHGNNVDLRGDVVVSADDEADGGSMHVYRMDPSSRQLRLLKDVKTGIAAHGICLYKSSTSGKLFAFPNAIDGGVEQWELGVNGGDVTAKSVREWDAGGAVEGCFADETNGKLYLGEEDVGVWIYGAEPGDGESRTKLDSAGSGGHLTADVEGIAAAGDRLFVSSQGSNDFAVYDRGSGSYQGRFAVASGTAADDCEDTDGIDATSTGLGSAFPKGVFVCQDGSNGSPGTSGNQNFKLVPLERVTEGLG
ncbi:phytase [Spirillospora sp. CA-294931]|uniref:phytase n=1 Tax=Spirillospora sp. CA-294931 TaxID=3240042 RepID=UPI003D8E952B